MKIIQITADPDPEAPGIYALTDTGQIFHGTWLRSELTWRYDLTPNYDLTELTLKANVDGHEKP